MKHYLHCHQGFDLNKGGTVGYLSSLLDGTRKIGRFTSSNEVRHAFLFPNIGPDERLPNQPCELLRGAAPFEVAYQQTPLLKYFNVQHWFHSVLPESEFLKIDVRKITSVHIHGAYNFLPVYNFLRLCGIENDVVKILTTHNPWKPEFEDVFHFTKNRSPEWLEQNAQKVEGYRHFLRLRDDFAFRMSDAWFFPSPHSMEGYYQDWPEFSEMAANKPTYFAVTGTERKEVFTSRARVRAKLGIPEEATVFLHLGRFIPMRGFDLYVEAAKRVLAKTENVWFLAVGEEQERPSIDDRRWIEVPFTTAPGDYLNACDACVIANRGSYFDLSMVEALSLGAPLVSAKVGGYKYLEGRTEGISYFEPGSLEGLVAVLLKFCQVSAETIRQWRKANEDLYEAEFTPEKFALGYQRTIDKIYRDFEIKPRNREIVRLPFTMSRRERGVFLNTKPAAPIEVPKGDKPKSPATKPSATQKPMTVSEAVNKAKGAEEMGIFREAANYYQLAVSLKPDQPHLRRRLAEALVKVGKNKEALSNLRYAQKLIPENKNLRRRIRSLERPIIGRLLGSKPFSG